MKIKKSFKWIILSSLLFTALLSFLSYIKISSKEPELSVVIPVYNASKYLQKCLDSLINQTYPNIEIICVNDGSKDNSLEILDNYKQKDNRIIVIDKQNGGVSSARNEGIRASHGKYITFVDPDDYIDTNAYEKCLNSMNKNNADMLVFEAIIEPSHSPFVKLSEKKYTDSFEAIDELYENIGVVWNKIFKKSLIVDNNILFDENIVYSEDNLFVNMAMPKAKTIATSSGVSYHYFYHSDSTACSVPIEKRLSNSIYRSKCLIDYYENQGYVSRYLWLLEYCINITYEYICELPDPKIQKNYSIKFLDIIDNRLLNKIDKVPQNLKDKIDTVRKYSE